MNEELRQAEDRLKQAESEIQAIREKIKNQKDAYRSALEVGNNQPCKVGILPNGKAVVNVQQGEGQVIHIVDPVYLNEDGSTRSQTA